MPQIRLLTGANLKELRVDSSQQKENNFTAENQRGIPMDKKEINSPKLTLNFLLWISGFMLLLFALIAHFVWKII
jgi:hypothetical protein